MYSEYNSNSFQALRRVLSADLVTLSDDSRGVASAFYALQTLAAWKKENSDGWLEKLKEEDQASYDLLLNSYDDLTILIEYIQTEYPNTATKINSILPEIALTKQTEQLKKEFNESVCATDSPDPLTSTAEILIAYYEKDSKNWLQTFFAEKPILFTELVDFLINNQDNLFTDKKNCFFEMLKSVVPQSEALTAISNELSQQCLPNCLTKEDHVDTYTWLSRLNEGTKTAFNGLIHEKGGYSTLLKNYLSTKNPHDFILVCLGICINPKYDLDFNADSAVEMQEKFVASQFNIESLGEAVTRENIKHIFNLLTKDFVTSSMLQHILATPQSILYLRLNTLHSEKLKAQLQQLTAPLDTLIQTLEDSIVDSDLLPHIKDDIENLDAVDDEKKCQTFSDIADHLRQLQLHTHFNEEPKSTPEEKAKQFKEGFSELKTTFEGTFLENHPLINFISSVCVEMSAVLSILQRKPDNMSFTDKKYAVARTLWGSSYSEIREMESLEEKVSSIQMISLQG